jgi:histidine phosphotransferase ChpT
MTPKPDPVALSALLASRLVHDLINPVGALDSGIEALDDPSLDEGMREAALDLVRTGGKKAIAVLKFARLAYGAAGGRGAELPMEEAEAVLRDLYLWMKAELDWRAPSGMRPKEVVKVVMTLAHAAADCVPRGGKVTVEGDGDVFAVTAQGPRALLSEELIAALNGISTDLKPKFAPAYIAGLLARSLGGGVSAVLEGEKVVFTAAFARAAMTAAR